MQDYVLSTKIRLGAVIAAAAVAVGGLALTSRSTPRGHPVRPGTVTAIYKCGDQAGAVKLSATRRGTRATVEVLLPTFRTPIPLYSGVLHTSLTLRREAGGTVTFEGNDNPTIPRGEPVRSGPLRGRVHRGDRLDTAVGRKSLTASVLGYRIACSAKTRQVPGPLEF